MENTNFHSSGTKRKIDQAIDVLYAGGVNNPMVAIEQISYLLFLKILTEKDKGRTAISKKYTSPFQKQFLQCSWDYLLPLSGDELVKSMRDAIEKIHELPDMSPTGQLLFRKATLQILAAPTLKAVMGIIDSLSSELLAESDVKGDAYEHLLKKLSTSGTNGQFRTPRHIIDLIVKLINPQIGDTICDPACGTGGFLISAHNHILSANTSNEAKQNNSPILGDLLQPKQWAFLDEQAFWGFDNDASMVKIAALNLYLHHLPKAKSLYHDTITTPIAGGYANQKFSVILANPPFSGKLQRENIQEDLNSGFDSKATELLFLKWIVDHLADGGRAGVIVPNGVLFGSTKAHLTIRKMLLEKCDLQGVISLPSGIFKPYSGVATSILIFEKGKPTQKVWFYEMTADGFSLDDKRNPIESTDIQDIIEKWNTREKSSKSLVVSTSAIKSNKYQLSINHYQEKQAEQISTLPPPKLVLQEVMMIQTEIASRLTNLTGRIHA